MASLPVAVLLRGSVTRGAVRRICGRMGFAMITMGHRPNGMLRHPGHERDEREHERPYDRGGGDTGSPFAVIPEAGAGEENDHERRQGQQPGKPEKRRQEGFQVHGITGAELTPSGRRPGRHRRWRDCCRS
jgi:hypothetical protein